MEEFNRYSIEELVFNTAFRQLVLHPTAKQEREFRHWIETHPQDRQRYVAAADLIRSVRIENAHLSASDQSEAVGHIFELTTRKMPVKSSHQFYYWAIAAAAILAIIIGFYVLPTKDPIGVNGYPAARISGAKWIWNNTTHAKLIQLGDGSSIFLKPGSAVRYPEHFTADTRKIDLRGEAFFEIAPDKSRPFYVYAGGAVTKVLGTSFSVRAIETEEYVMVGVRSGKVNVSHFKGNEPVPSVPVVPGQQAIVSRHQQGIETALLKADDEIGIFLTSAATGNQIEVVEYLKTAEKAFGLSITFDQKKLKTCKIRANFEGMHLMEQIDAMCKAINAQYTVRNGRIIIKSLGC